MYSVACQSIILPLTKVNFQRLQYLNHIVQRILIASSQKIILFHIIQYHAMTSSRLFRFPKPEWVNSPNTRTAGVYLAGALVSPSIYAEPHSGLYLTVIS